jgi:Holliday junction resolvasome RuvABC endonuclease subunit
MRIVGLDLSLTATGIAVLQAGIDTEITTLCTVKSQGVPVKNYPGVTAYHAEDLLNKNERINLISDAVLRIVVDAEPANLVVLEGRSFASQGQAVWDIAWLWGFIAHQLIQHEVPVAIVAPGTLKHWAAGKGTASKVDVAAALTRLWPDVTPGNDNEFDALGLATMGAQQLGANVPRLARHAVSLTKVWWPWSAVRPAVAVH